MLKWRLKLIEILEGLIAAVVRWLLTLGADRGTVASTYRECL